MTEFHTPLGDAPSQSALVLPFAPAFPTTCSCWWALPSIPTCFLCSNPSLWFHSSCITPFCSFQSRGLTWCMLGCLLTHGSSRISREGGADRVFLSLPGLSHRLPVPVCTAALLCHVLWPPQRQREASAAGHWDIDPLQRPHLPDLNNRLFFANSTFYDWT